jgi:hypothetical protein
MDTMKTPEPFGCASTSRRPTARIMVTSCSMLEKRDLEMTWRRTSSVSKAVAREPTICLDACKSLRVCLYATELTAGAASTPDSRQHAELAYLLVQMSFSKVR